MQWILQCASSPQKAWILCIYVFLCIMSPVLLKYYQQILLDYSRPEIHEETTNWWWMLGQFSIKIVSFSWLRAWLWTHFWKRQTSQSWYIDGSCRQIRWPSNFPDLVNKESETLFCWTDIWSLWKEKKSEGKEKRERKEGNMVKHP